MMPERGVRAADHLRAEMDEPVAAADHQGLGAVGHRRLGQGPGLVGVAADQVVHA